MTMRRWLLAGTFVFGGCATFGGGSSISDRDIASLPAQDRAQIVTAQHSIDVAKANVDTAKVQRDEARQFRHVAQSELMAARDHLDAARGSIELAHSTRDVHELRNAQRNEDIARQQLLAARAKLDYADRLLALRDARVDEADAQLKAARADVEMQKANILERDGVAARVDMNRIRNRRDDAQERLAEQRSRVATLAGEVQQLRLAWDDRRREFNTASRDTGAPMMAPRSREMLTVPPVRDPRGDVNDTPGAPELPNSQERQPTIAPNP
jgi:chromosome segregation ATPase